MIDHQLKPMWVNNLCIEFKYNDKNVVLEFNQHNEKIIFLTIREFFVNGIEHYRQIFDHIALRVSARSCFVKIFPDQNHYSARFEYYIQDFESFSDELFIALNKIGNAISEFFLRLDIIEEDLSIHNSILNQINLN